MTKTLQVTIIGGGAAGFFAAITAKRINPNAHVLLLEKSAQLLSKVKVSGGGRCNVTHHCFEPTKLIQNYPRGSKALLGPFNRFGPTDTIRWFESRGVPLKVEADGRMFPSSDSSQSIIDALTEEAKKLGVEIRLRQNLTEIIKHENGFTISLASGESLLCDRLLLATGSSPQGHALAKSLGHTIVAPIPSLFTFNVPSSPLIELAGIALNPVELRITGTRLSQTGPLLITHWGFSGPAALKLSAWGAKELHSANYKVQLVINWLPKNSCDELKTTLVEMKTSSTQCLANENPFDLPKNLWKKLLDLATIDGRKKAIELPNKELHRLAERLHADLYQVDGKTTYKEEFVTCGGVELKEVDFRTLESRLCPKLYFAGEVLDIDAVTGGFNFQNAWTTAWIAGHAMVNKEIIASQT